MKALHLCHWIGHKWRENLTDGVYFRPIGRYCVRCFRIEFDANANLSEWAKSCYIESITRTKKHDI